MSSITLSRKSGGLAMRHTMRRYQVTTLSSWLLMAGVLVPWCRHRPVSHKAVKTVNDTCLRALVRGGG
jgi:hypothetical protein